MGTSKKEDNPSSDGKLCRNCFKAADGQADCYEPDPTLTVCLNYYGTLCHICREEMSKPGMTCPKCRDEQKQDLQLDPAKDTGLDLGWAKKPPTRQ